MSSPSNAPPSGNPATNPQLSYNTPAPVEPTPQQEQANQSVSLPPTRLQQGVKYQSPQETAQKNAGEPFLKITGPSGAVVAYAEYGKLVSQSQFEQDIQGSSGSISSTFYTYDGKNFSNETDLQGYVKSQYPNSVVIPVLGPSSSGQLQITGFKISTPSGSGRGNTVDQMLGQTDVQAPVKTDTGIVSTIEKGAATAYSDIGKGFTDLFMAGASTGRYVASGGKTSQVALTPDQAQRLTMVTENASYILPGGAILHGVGVTDEPASARVFDLAIGLLPFVPGSGLGGSAVKVATSLAGRAAIGAGIGAVGGLAYGETPLQIAENTALGAASAVAFHYGMKTYSKAGGLFESIRNPTRPVPETLTPFLSKFTIPEEVGTPEFGSSGVGQVVRVGQKGYTNIFVREMGDITMSGDVGSDIGIRTEPEIIESSVMSQKDLNKLVAGPKSFVAYAESRAPPKVAGVEDYRKFASGFSKGAQEADVAKSLEEPSVRANEVTNALKKYEERSIQGSGGQKAVVIFQQKEIELTAMKSSEDFLQSSITEARLQAEMRFAVVRSIARRGRVADYFSLAFYTVPPGVVRPAPPVSRISLGSTPISASDFLSKLDIGTGTSLSLRSVQSVSLREVQLQRQEVNTKQLQREAQIQSLSLSIRSLEEMVNVEELVGISVRALTETKTKRKRKGGKKKESDYIRPNQLSLNVLNESLPFELKGLL